MRAAVGLFLLVATAGIAQARSVVKVYVPPPALQEGCGADGKLTPELAALKLQGAANLQPCKVGTIAYVTAKVSGKTLVGFVAHVAGMKVGRLYVNGKPVLDETDFVKKLGGAKKLYKMKDADLVPILTIAASVKAVLEMRFTAGAFQYKTDFPDAAAKIDATRIGFNTETDQKVLRGFSVSKFNSCRTLAMIQVAVTKAGGFTVTLEGVGSKGC